MNATTDDPELDAFLASHAPKNRQPKAKPPRRTKFAGVKVTGILLNLPDDQLAEIDRVAALARFLQGGRPCPRSVVIRTLIEDAMGRLRPELEATATVKRT